MIDTETGSAKAYNTALLQVAFILYDTEKKKFIDKFNMYCKPFNSDPVPEDGALLVNHIIREDIEEFPDPVSVQRAICAVFSKYVDKFNTKDKMQFVAYNAPFDYEVLQKFWKKCNDDAGTPKNYLGSWFWKQPLDVMILAAECLKEVRPEMENFKQLTVAKQLGIEFDEDNLHDALEDIKLMIKIYKKIGCLK
jgi:DNA polymerase III epsilon subunit-like protein